MEHIEVKVVQATVERRLAEGLRILSHSDPTVHATNSAYSQMRAESRESILGHIASMVSRLVHQHYNEQQKSAACAKTVTASEIRFVAIDPASSASGPTTDLSPAAREALMSVINATGWDSQRVVNEAILFLWAAMQQQLAPAE